MGPYFGLDLGVAHKDGIRRIELHAAQHVGLVEPLPDVVGAARLQRHTEHLEAALAVLVVELAVFWNLGPARGAPGGPKIENNHLALEVGRAQRAAVESREEELRRGREALRAAFGVDVGVWEDDVAE